MSVVGVSVARPCQTMSEVVAALGALRPHSRQTIVAFLPDGDYRFDVACGANSAVVRLHATLREDRAAGGTWWTSRTVRLCGASAGDLGHRVGNQVVAEVTALRGRFVRQLREYRARGTDPGRAADDGPPMPGPPDDQTPDDRDAVPRAAGPAGHDLTCG